MRIVCPSCAAAYEVPVERLGPGRAVQCSACKAGWTPRPLLTGTARVSGADGTPNVVTDAIADAGPNAGPNAGPDAVVGAKPDGGLGAVPPPPMALSVAPPAIDPDTKPVPHPTVAARPASDLAYPRIAPVVLAGWLATVLIIGGALWMGFARRDGVMEAWPPSERVYKAFGYRRG